MPGFCAVGASARSRADVHEYYEGEAVAPAPGLRAVTTRNFKLTHYPMGALLSADNVGKCGMTG